MRSVTIITTFLAIAVLSLGSAAAADSPTTKATAVGGRLAKGESTSAPLNVITGLASMPLAFTENQGQWDDQVLFRANAGGATMWFTKDGAYYQFTRRIRVGQEPCAPDTSDHDVGTTGVPTYRGADVTQPGEPVSGVEGWPDQPSRGRQMSTSAPSSIDAAHEDIRRAQVMGTPPLAVGSDSIETMMIKANFVGSNPQPTVHGEGLLEYKCNYFLGNDPAKWRTNVPNYQAVVYEDIYPGIDLKYYGNGKQMEYDFIVSPGADPSQIQVRYEGAKSLHVNEAGQLVVETGWGTVTELKPLVYQLDGGVRVLIEGKYLLLSENTFGFVLPECYNPELVLVIDPGLVYSTYLGGGTPLHDEEGTRIAVDAAGAAYVTGYTYSTDFPMVNPYDSTVSGDDAFVTKLSSSGSSLVYSTYLGGSGSEWSWDIAVDADGAAYVKGHTSSSDFPTVNPYDDTLGGSCDAFVTKLSSGGDSLIYSTYLGGSGVDGACFGIEVDAAGAAYVTGYTGSSDFPMVNPYDSTLSDTDAFVTKLSSGGDSLVYSTYLGGSGVEWGLDMTVDSAGAAYVTGRTYSSDFPTVNPYDDTLGGNCDAFVTKLSSGGDSLIYSTYLGGSLGEEVYGIVVDAAGAAYVVGFYTYSTDFPTVNPYDSTLGGNSDAFVTKLSSGGDSLVYSTYLGGNARDRCYSIAVDAGGAAYVTGNTYSSDFPTLNPYQNTNQGQTDVIVTKLSASGSSLVYSTYLGGSFGEMGHGITVDAAGAAYVVGATQSLDDFPMVNPYQGTYGGGKSDVFVAKLSEGGTCCNGDGIHGDVNYDMSLNVADLNYLVDYLLYDGPPPPCPEEGDVDGSGATNVADLAYLVSYLFDQPPGPPPPPCP